MTQRPPVVHPPECNRSTLSLIWTHALIKFLIRDTRVWLTAVVRQAGDSTQTTPLGRIFSRANPGYTCVANGCGPAGGRQYPNHPFGADFQSCCNDHDCCYGNCNNVK